MKLEIQKFGGRGASSSNTQNEAYKQYVARALSNPEYMQANRPNEYLMNMVGANEMSNREIKAIKSQKALKELANEGKAIDITRFDDASTKALREQHGSLEKVKVISGTYGMNGALLRSRETGQYFVITSRNSNLFYWV